MSVKITPVSLNNIPLSLDCTNQTCAAELQFTMNDITTGEVVTCESCGTSMRLDEVSQ
jgi:aspartate carbamoyltransferase regulatory subunit